MRTVTITKLDGTTMELREVIVHDRLVCYIEPENMIDGEPVDPSVCEMHARLNEQHDSYDFYHGVSDAMLRVPRWVDLAEVARQFGNMHFTGVFND